MGKDLFIGNSSFDYMKDDLVAYGESLDLGDEVARLFEGPEDKTALCFLNGASVMVFLDHIASLEGHADSRSAFAAFERGDTAFKNVPWWDDAVWLPFDVPRVGPMKDDPDSFATFVGSATALARELPEIQRRSPLGLGAEPPGYARMRQDITEFYKDMNFRLDGDTDIIRWIWLALNDGAELAIHSRAILSGGPG